MSDKTNLTKAWLMKANNDLITAKKLIDSDGPFDTACFHLQQAIEKALKAFLVFHEQFVPKIHDLEELQRRCRKLGISPELESFDLSEITDFAVEMRYDLEFWPEIPDVLNALEITNKIMTLVLANLPNECHF
ncbi:HEPN domain-containing protein [candidate division KSB1 bacterium]|nr:HEPN domain-containing protein [candidate division KSB1 bacterium]